MCATRMRPQSAAHWKNSVTGQVVIFSVKCKRVLVCVSVNLTSNTDGASISYIGS